MTWPSSSSKIFLGPRALQEDRADVLDVHLACGRGRIAAQRGLLALGRLPGGGLGEAAHLRHVVIDGQENGRLARSHELRRHLHEVHGEDPGELRKALRPPLQQTLGHGAAGELQVSPHEALQILQLGRVGAVRFLGVHLAHLHGRWESVLRELVLGVPNPSDASAHAGRQVHADRAQDDDPATGHVLTAVVTGALDDGPCAGVAHGEALGRDASHEADAGSGAIEGCVSNDDVVFGNEASLQRLGRRVDGKGTATEALSEVVLGVALQLQEDALQGEGPEGLAGGPCELGVASACLQAVPPALVQLVRQQCAAGPVDVREFATLTD